MSQIYKKNAKNGLYGNGGPNLHIEKSLMNCCDYNRSILLAFYISKFAYCNIKNGLNTIPIYFSVKYAEL